MKIANKGKETDHGSRIERQDCPGIGAGGGLGGAIAKTLAVEGARIAVADINREAAEKTVADIRTAGGSAMALQWDLAELGVIEPKLATIEKQLGSVDVLVNITGGPPPTLVSGQSAETWRKYFDSMVLSVIAISDAVLPKMREKIGAASSPRRRRGLWRPSLTSDFRIRCACRFSAGRKPWRVRSVVMA